MNFVYTNRNCPLTTLTKIISLFSTTNTAKIEQEHTFIYICFGLLCVALNMHNHKFVVFFYVSQRKIIIIVFHGSLFESNGRPIPGFLIRTDNQYRLNIFRMHYMNFIELYFTHDQMPSLLEVYLLAWHCICVELAFCGSS